MSAPDRPRGEGRSQAPEGSAVTLLWPMRAETFDDFAACSVAAYAAESVACGRMSGPTALTCARAELELLLPQGLQTPDQHLFEIVAGEVGPRVGHLWFAVESRHGLRQAFLCDLSVRPEFRRQGHARRALRLLEPRVASLGLSGIGLHVFARNAAAQALYRELGYAVTSLNMVKPIRAGVDAPSSACSRDAA